jgi:hypothetical protein
MQRDDFQPLNDDNTDGWISSDDIEEDSSPHGNHPNLVNFNNHYIPYSHNNYNMNLVNDSLVPRTIPVPVKNANFNINQDNELFFGS